MGSDREYTKAELRQMELDQQDPKFVEWLAGMDDALTTFFAEDVPDMPADPFTAEGLRHAEQAALGYFWRRDRSWLDREPRFQRFVGETFARAFEGRWAYVDVSGDGHAPVVSLPASALFLQVDALVSRAMTKKTGELWAWVFGNDAELYAEWVAAGRLPPREWLDYQVKQDLER